MEKLRISEADFTAALELYKVIYEQKLASESGPEHERLAQIINTAAGTDPHDLKMILKKPYDFPTTVSH